MSPRFLRHFRRKSEPQPPSTGGRTVVAIGDVHGRLDLLVPLISQIKAALSSSAGQAKPVLVFVGDYVDRGPSSKGVIDAILQLRLEEDFDIRTLRGNHEEALLAFLQDANFGPTWSEQGGAQTLTSYGINPPMLRTDTAAWERARDAFAEALPREHQRFLANLELWAVYGDYVFVHAGLRPGIALEAQEERDLLWIRHDFLNSTRSFGQVVVHGHTPESEPFLGAHRIGIDTGAYATGVLTAVLLRDAERTLVQAKVPQRR